MSIGFTYDETQVAAYVGDIVNMIPATLISRTVEADVGFGVAMVQGTEDKAARALTTGDAAADYVGFTVRERSVQDGEDKFLANDTARLITKGVIWLQASVAVAAGDAVYIVPATGAVTNVSTSNVLIAGARFDTSTTGAGLVQVRLG